MNFSANIVEDSKGVTLQSVLAVGATHANRQLRASGAALGARLDSIVIFGCGPLGRFTAQRLKALGRPILAFSDNAEARWGTLVDGVAVLPPASAVERYGASAVFVVAIYNGSAVRSQLTRAGCQFVLHSAALFHSLPEAFLPYGSLCIAEQILSGAAAIFATATLWADAASGKEFIDQVRWRLGDDDVTLAPPDPMSDLYFARDLFVLDSDDVLIDCGAFDGDSLRSFLANPHHAFGSYIALEPDPNSHAALKACVERLPSDVRAKVRTLAVAAASKKAVTRFTATGSVASHSDAAGDVDVPTDTLDALVGDARPTFIKMDIEGQEEDALVGAAKIIRERHPILAISLYHKPDDLWRIPALIHSILPEYLLYLRRYAEDCWETVCYAIPRSRLQKPIPERADR